VELGDLTGRVWVDRDGDGIEETGEASQSGITVRLLSADGSFTGRTATTGADGTYLFEDVVAGDYRVEFVLPAGLRLTHPDQGSDNSVDSDASPGTGISEIATVRPAEVTRDLDAGVYVPASIGDRVWEDVNGDGLQNDGATGIVGATVQLLDGNTVIATTTTGADGFYEFTGLAPGAYRIQVLPAGFAATGRNLGGDEALDSDIDATGRSDAFTLASGQVEARLDAGLYRPAKLGGTLFEDVNGDGLQGGPGEAGISGRVVELLDSAGNPTGRTAVTDVNGDYLFDNLAPGTYAVRFVPNAATPFTKANVGSNDLIDSDADLTTGKTASITLTSGGDDRSLDAGVYRPATIGDFVFEDLDGDGQQDLGEPGVTGATVRLLNSDGTPVAGVATVTTGADGAYSFTGLAPGDYRVEVTRTGFTPTQRDQGADATDSDIGSDGRTGVVNLVSGEVDNSVDAGLYRPASIGDRVWLDTDNDGQQDPGEAGLDGVTVRLLSANGGTVLATTTTAGGGLYRFEGLAPGDYRVQFERPADRAFGKQDQGADGSDSDADAAGLTGIVTLISGENNTSIDAGVVELGDLTGRVWVDRDGDGIEETGEASQSGITVRLLNADGSFTGRTATTGADGTYLFENLIAGDYRVEFVLPAGLRLTRPDQGSDNSVDSDANPGTRISEIATVRNAEVTRDLDAGVYVPASIGDRVWHDLDADGVQDAGEPGLANVRVQLIGADGVTVLATDFTDAQGIYGFDGLAPDTYSIRVQRLSGYEFSQRDRGGNDALDSDVSTQGLVAPTFLFSGDARTDVDAGQFQRVTIGDRVWFDSNANGRQDDGEPGARGVTVRLLDANGNVIATTVTDANGAYAFRNQMPGTYSVQFVPPAGTVFTGRDLAEDTLDSDANMTTGRTAPVTLTSGQSNTTLDAGLKLAAQLGDRVWADRNANGRQDEGEPGIGNVTVRLLDLTGMVVATTTTDASGWYRFANVHPGTYRVQFVTPAGHTPSQADATDDALDSDALAGGTTAPIALGQGAVVLTVDAGFIPDFVHPCDLPPLVLTDGPDGYSGTNGPDKVDGAGGNDNLHGLGGDDCLRGNDGDDVLLGHDGNDTLKGDGGNDNLHGNAGNDLIFGGDGDDTVEGGDGEDWIEGGRGRDNIQGEGGNDTIFAGEDDDIAVGNAGDDIIFGQSGNDDIQGHEGADTLIGGADRGTARLAGVRIGDIVLGDTVSGGSGADHFIYQRGDGVDFMLDFNPAEGDRLTVYGFSAPIAVGKFMGEQTILYFGVDSALVFNNAYAQGVGLAGPFPGITFVPGTNVAPGLPQPIAPIVGTFGADSLAGGNDGDLIEGLQGNDTLAGNAGADTLLGGAGDDVLLGGAGADRMDGGTGRDTLSYADATAGVRASLAGAGSGGFAQGDLAFEIEDLIGSGFADTLTGDAGGNAIAGGAGNDSLQGAAGDDTLTGGAGADTLLGGTGADRFLWASLAESATATPDLVRDFSWIEGDRLDLSAIDAGTAAGDQAFLFVGSGAFVGGGQGSIRSIFQGTDTVLQIDSGNGGAAEAVIRLTGLHSLAAADFIL
jgi:Ca2+-binding RTX toxin-like protein/protocatechuate 3,4-dioxygenase beta subunit